MAAIPDPAAGRPAPGPLARLLDRLRVWRAARVADPAFQARATAFPLTRPLVRARAVALHELVAGFVQSQVLAAFVELDLLARLARAPGSAEALAPALGLAPERAERLLLAGEALGLVARLSDGRFVLADLGAAALGAPGVAAMVRHHRLLYADLADPVALLRGERETRLSRFYGYTAGRSTHGMAPEEAAPYSALMAASQAMVAEETIASGALRGIRHLLDVGGGEGAFLAAALAADPALTGTLFDLPAVVARADPSRFPGRMRIAGGSFLSDSLPAGADAVSLVRVLYDHEDATVRALLASVRAALPRGGRLILSEPMAGGRRPNRAGDVYFAFYTLAMGTGRPRAPETLAALLVGAGFARVRVRRVRRPFITGVLTAVAA